MPIGIITGFAAAPDGTIFLSAQVQVATAGGPAKQDHVFFTFTNNFQREWTPIYSSLTSTQEPKLHAVFAAEDQQILVSTRLPRLEWIRFK
jgi:hypothetical protein